MLRSPRSSRLFRAAAVSVVGVLALAGCNDSDSAAEIEGLSPVAAVQKAAENASNDSAAYTFELAGSGLDLRGSGKFAGGENPAAQLIFDKMSMTGLAGLVGNGALPEGLELRLVDDVMYLKMTGEKGLVSGLGNGEWVKLPVEDLQAEGASIGGLDPATMADPREQLRTMLDTEDVREVGTETIDGVKVTHYEAEVDAEGTGTVVEKRTSEGQSELEKRLEKSLEDSIRSNLGVDSPVEIDVWVDREYRARKLAVELPFLGGATMTMKFSDFGSDVNVEAPAGAKEFDAADLMGEFSGEALGGDLGKLFGDAFEGANGEDFSADLSEDFEARLRERIESQLREGFGGSMSDEEVDALVRNS